MKQLDEAIFIHRIPYSESSLIVTFLTKEHGYQKFLFKGGKKKSHQLYPLSVSEIEYYSRKESDLWNVTSAEPLFVQKIQFDPVKSTIAFFMADVLNMVLRGTERDVALFHFVSESIKQLDQTEELNLFPSIFLVGLTKHLGVQPLVENNESPWLDLKSGSIGGYRENDTISVEGPIIEVVIDTLSQRTPSIELNKQQRQELLRVMLDYYKIHVPGFKEPGTYDIIREILA